MKKFYLVAILLCFLMAGTANATITIGGQNFADNAFADQLISYSGTFANNSSGILNAAQLAAVLTDKDAGTYAYSNSPGAYVQLGFTDNSVVNGTGNDLAFFDLGVNATFPISLTIGGTTLSYNTFDTGFTTGTPEGVTYNLNVALVNLDDFGLASGALLNSVVIGMSSGGTVPSLGIAGALNSTSSSVPEPASLLLLGLGLMGVAGIRRIKK